MSLYLWRFRGRVLFPSAREDLDLGVGLLDAKGNTIAFTKVLDIRVRAAKANVNDVVIGGAPHAAFLGPFGSAYHTVRLVPGAWVRFTASGNGWTVQLGIADLLRISNGGAGSAVAYDIRIVGQADGREAGLIARLRNWWDMRAAARAWMG